MFCRFCGYQLSQELNFCPQCGNAIDNAVSYPNNSFSYSSNNTLNGFVPAYDGAGTDSPAQKETVPFSLDVMRYQRIIIIAGIIEGFKFVLPFFGLGGLITTIIGQAVSALFFLLAIYLHPKNMLILSEILQIPGLIQSVYYSFAYQHFPILISSIIQTILSMGIIMGTCMLFYKKTYAKKQRQIIYAIGSALYWIGPLICTFLIDMVFYYRSIEDEFEQLLVNLIWSIAGIVFCIIFYFIFRNQLNKHNSYENKGV